MNQSHSQFNTVSFSAPRNPQEQHAFTVISEFKRNSDLKAKQKRADRVTTIVLCVAVAICAIGGTWLIVALS